jgi:D-alanyl-lipoteichoic acid acyltransferase DltB (MBOAT superfamily)
LTLRNLMLTMLIGGLWHGAAWHFVVWVGLRGLWLIIEGVLADQGCFRVDSARRFGRAARATLTLVAVVYAWAWFRATDLDYAFAVSRALADVLSLLSAWPTRDARDTLALLAFAAIVAMHSAMLSTTSRTCSCGLLSR